MNLRRRVVRRGVGVEERGVLRPKVGPLLKMEMRGWVAESVSGGGFTEKEGGFPDAVYGRDRRASVCETETWYMGIAVS